MFKKTLICTALLSALYAGLPASEISLDWNKLSHSQKLSVAPVYAYDECIRQEHVQKPAHHAKKIRYTPQELLAIKKKLHASE